MKKLGFAVILSSALLCNQVIAMSNDPVECPSAQEIIDAIVDRDKLHYITTPTEDGNYNALLSEDTNFVYWTGYWCFTLGPFNVSRINYTLDTNEPIDDYVKKVMPSMSGEPTPVADTDNNKWLCIYDIDGYTAIAEKDDCS